MKKLILVRHAKSSWKHEVSDTERPLKRRGITDASIVSKHIEDKIGDSDFVYSSPANRALATCKIFLKSLSISEEKLNISDNLYDFGGSQLTEFIKNIPNNYCQVMVFGHNHAITAFVNTYGNEYIDNVPTCGVVVLEFDIESWGDLKLGKTELYIFPKMLKN